MNIIYLKNNFPDPKMSSDSKSVLSIGEQKKNDHKTPNLSPCGRKETQPINHPPKRKQALPIFTTGIFGTIYVPTAQRMLDFNIKK